MVVVGAELLATTLDAQASFEGPIALDFENPEQVENAATGRHLVSVANAVDLVAAACAKFLGNCGVPTVGVEGFCFAARLGRGVAGGGLAGAHDERERDRRVVKAAIKLAVDVGDAGVGGCS